MPNTLGILGTAQAAFGIQEHHDQFATGHIGLHHQTTTGLGDVARLLQADVPLGVADQSVGIVETQRAAAQRQLVAGGRGQVPQNRPLVGDSHQRRQIAGAGLVLAHQAGGLNIPGVVHAQITRLGVHQPHKTVHTARERAPQSMGRAVFAGHQSQVHHLATAQGGAHGQA